MAGQEGREEEELGSKSVLGVESEARSCELESRRAGSRPMRGQEMGLASESPFRNQEVDWEGFGEIPLSWRSLERALVEKRAGDIRAIRG